MPRQKVFTVQTPFAQVSTATLWDNTWADHIVKGHPEMAGKMSQMQQTLQSPSLVCTASSPGYFTFVNHAELDAQGNPLLVVVSTSDSSGTPAVATSYHGGKKYLNATKLNVVWP